MGPNSLPQGRVLRLRRLWLHPDFFQAPPPELTGCIEAEGRADSVTNLAMFVLGLLCMDHKIPRGGRHGGAGRVGDSRCGRKWVTSRKWSRQGSVGQMRTGASVALTRGMTEKEGSEGPWKMAFGPTVLRRLSQEDLSLRSRPAWST